MDEPQKDTGPGILSSLVDVIGPTGVVVVVVLTLAALWLLKYKTVRRAVWKVTKKLYKKTNTYVRLTWWASRLGIGIRLARRLQPKRWHKMCEERQLAGLKRGKIKRTKVGIDINVTFNLKLTAEYVQDKLTALETGLGIRKGCMRLIEGNTANKGALRISLRGVLPAILPMEIPEGETSIKDGWQLVNEFGETTTVNLRQRILITGASGSGKSTAQRSLSTRVLRAYDADMEMWDLKKGLESQHYEGKVLHRVIDAASALERIEYLLTDEMERRAEIMKALKTSTWPTSRRHRDRIVQLDEGNVVIREFTPKQIGRLFTLIEQARAFGIYVWWATQFPTADNLPTELRSQFTCFVALLMEKASESRIVFEDGVSEGWAPHRLPGVGWCLVRDAQHRQPEQYKIPFIDEIPFREMSVNVGTEAPAVSKPAVEFVPADAEMSSEDKMIFALRSAGEGGAHYKELMKFLDLSQPRVYQIRDKLLSEGRIQEAGRGRVALVLEEASA